MNTNYKYIEIESEDKVATLWLNRPEKNNAFDENMIGELLDFFEKISQESSLDIIVIRGRGKHFSAGADLDWMRKADKMTYEENYAGALKLARLFYSIYHCPLITVARVHGSCYGGANGIVAATDFSYASDTSAFVFSEARLGLVAATIAPYVINKAGTTKSLDWFLSARMIKAKEAKKTGLINKVLKNNKLDNYIKESLKILQNNSRQSQLSAKKLVKELSTVVIDEQIIKSTAEITAKARISSDAQERIASFFAKHKQSWK